MMYYLVPWASFYRHKIMQNIEEAIQKTSHMFKIYIAYDSILET